MNKYYIIALVIFLIILGGFVYRTRFLPEDSAPLITGVVRELTVIAKQNEWRFEPESIEVNHGDRVIMTVINQDNYDHGMGLDAYGISQRMPANSTIIVEFVATQQGDFPFYCSVPCGEGEVDGEHRDHFDMVGQLKVKNLVTDLE